MLVMTMIIIATNVKKKTRRFVDMTLEIKYSIYRLSCMCSFSPRYVFIYVREVSYVLNYDFDISVRNVLAYLRDFGAYVLTYMYCI